MSDFLGELKKHPLFSMLQADDLPRLLDQDAPSSFNPGDVLYRQGTPAERLILIRSGQVDLIIERPGHPTETLTRLESGASIGADALIPGALHAATARAVTTVNVIALSGPAMQAHLDGRFDQALTLIAEMAGALRCQIKEITELKLQSTTQRLASYLLVLAGSRDGAAQLRLPCEKRLLAERLGMEPATLSRAFAKLREVGVEAGRGDRVMVNDLSLLAEMIDSDETLGSELSP